MSTPALRIDDDSIILNGRSDSDVQLLVLHHAGGSALSFLPLARTLPPTVEVRLFDLPGRGLRSREPAAATFEDAVEDMFPRLAVHLHRPSVVLGHSLGGLLADAVVHRLDAGQRGAVLAVVLSATPSPPLLPTPGPVAPRTRGRLEQDVREFGGTPPEVLGQHALLAGVLRLLGQDLLLVDTYVWPEVTQAAHLAPTEYHVWNGVADRTLCGTRAEAWASPVRSPVRSRTFPGGHFYLMNAASGAATALGQLVGAARYAHDNARRAPADPAHHYLRTNT